MNLDGGKVCKKCGHKFNTHKKQSSRNQDGACNVKQCLCDMTLFKLAFFND